MALPASVETERNRYLLGLVKSASEPIINWPAPNKEDVILIGKIILLYSYIDFNLRRMIEVLEHAKALPTAWLGKTAKMHLSDIETVLETATDISPDNALALRRIKEFSEASQPARSLRDQAVSHGRRACLRYQGRFRL
jgi:hypothetical protein